MGLPDVKAWLRAIRGPRPQDLGPDRPDGNAVLSDFVDRCRAMSHPRVLELGAKRSISERSTLRHAWVPNAGEYLGADLTAGVDVDIVADVHRLTDVVGEEQFDVIICCATFEHLKYPHLAAHQMMRALRVGGVLFVHTVQTFALHSFPYDYFRFSREAVAGLFGTQMGFRVMAADYEFPARIHAPALPEMATMPAFLNVRLWGEKVGPTPREYIYEFDV
jgi:hypothetical protein